MPDTKAAPISETTSRARSLGRSPSGAELAYTLVALFSFAAALYALWLASISAGLTPGPQLVGSNSAAAQSASAGIAWGPVVLACLVAAGLIWVCIHMLSKSSDLASVRHVVATTQKLNIPDAVKLEVIVATAGTAFQRVGPGLTARPPGDEAVRAGVAGNWVLERFREGASVVAVPESLATSERLQTAFGAPGERPIQILRNDLDLGKAGKAP